MAPAQPAMLDCVLALDDGKRRVAVCLGLQTERLEDGENEAREGRKA